MTIGSLGYVLNDAAVRRITEDGPDVYQVLFMRGVCLTVLFGGLARLQGRTIPIGELRGPLGLRVFAESIAAALFFAAVVRIEFANAQAILQAVPFAVTLAAALVLKERVTVRLYLAVLMGFAGVLVVVRPATDGFSGWSIVVLASAAFIVVRELATRDINPEIGPAPIAFVTAAGLTALTGVLSVFDDWQGLTGAGWVFLAVAVLSLAIGFVFTIQTVRIGDLSVSAPFRYTTLIGAVVLGYVLFDEAPDRYMVIGSVIIVASGLYALHLDRQAAVSTTPPPNSQRGVPPG